MLCGAAAVDPCVEIPNGGCARSFMLSVVILNWDRLHHVKRIVEKYQSYPDVREVLVVNSNPDAEFPSVDKLTVMQTTRDFGLDSRFAAAAMAATDQVLLQDDDILLPQKTVAALSDASRREPMRLHGLFGRNPNSENEYALFYERTSAVAEIILTRAVVAWQSQISEFFPARTRTPIIAARRRHREFQTNPHNGEDIIFSYAVSAATGERHRVHDFEVEELHGMGLGISETGSGHYEFRTEIMRAAQMLRRS